MSEDETAFRVLSSELKLLLIAFLIGLQEGQNLPPPTYSGLHYQAGESSPAHFQSGEQEINKW